MSTSMKKVFIMRGIPGSGKTTAARALAGKEGIIHSTDEYFEINGIYKFDTTRLQEYHDRNFEAFSMSLKENISIVICDNVNQKYIHYKRYIHPLDFSHFVIFNFQKNELLLNPERIIYGPLV